DVTAGDDIIAVQSHFLCAYRWLVYALRQPDQKLRNRLGGTMLYQKIIASPVGKLRIISSDKGLRYVGFESDAGRHVTLEDAIETNDEHIILLKTEAQLSEYFNGSRTSFDVPLELKGTVFQLNAWRALQKIPYGKTKSYGE